MDKIIIASANKGKIKEFKELLGDKFEILSMAEAGFCEDIEENGTTFEENATIKAKTIFDKTGIAVIGDDSGLCVPSLGGEPGIYSARYAGPNADMEQNKKLLLDNLRGKDRYAYFICCLVLYDGKTHAFEGKCEGEILFEEKGLGGFGYDGLFYSLDLKKSFGESSRQEKNSVSHRARAIQKLCNYLK